MNISFQLGIAYEKASQGQNVAEFNALVDTYNAWIRQNFGEDANLLKAKMNYTPPVAVSPKPIDTPSVAVSPETNDTIPVTVSTETNDATPRSQYKNPFESGSELSKFGKQQVRAFADI